MTSLSFASIYLLGWWVAMVRPRSIGIYSLDDLVTFLDYGGWQPIIWITTRYCSNHHAYHVVSRWLLLVKQWQYMTIWHILKYFSPVKTDMVPVVSKLLRRPGRGKSDRMASRCRAALGRDESRVVSLRTPMANVAAKPFGIFSRFSRLTWTTDKTSYSCW